MCVEAYHAWLSTEARTDDITVIVIEFTLGKGLTCALSWLRLTSTGCTSSSTARQLAPGSCATQPPGL